MNTLRYNGYIGTVCFSEKDGLFYGKIEGINSLINFEGDSVKSLTDAFHEAIDDYLLFCKENGIEPQKSYSGSLNVRLTPQIHSQVATLAKLSGITINAFIRRAIEKEVAIELMG